MGEFRPCPKEGPKPKKTPKALKRSAIKKKFKATGEKETFHEVLDSLSDFEPTTCFVCGINVAVVTHCNMAHVLSKGKYPLFRNNPDNIRILCHRIIADENGQGCHFAWDMTPRSKLVGEGWERMKELEIDLKEEYNSLTDL